MNCDQAFEYLTDAALRRSPRLATHLACCPRCREMQDVLSPAWAEWPGDAELAAGDDYAAAGETFPRDRPFLTPEAVEVAERAAARLKAARPDESEETWRQWTRRGVVAAALICALGGAMFALQGATEPRSGLGSPLCTRIQFGRLDLGPQPVDAHSVILSCTACHIRDR